MGRHRRKGRAVSGILILDKRAGLTSNGALQEVKRLFGAAKAGHTGSLDPLATGVLPLCFGEATKFSQFLLEANKRYVTCIKLGVSTNTGDADGEILQRSEVGDYSDKKIKAVLAEFTGEIEQLPSMYSALKVNGEPLYKLARQGLEVERKKRKVTIFELQLIEKTADELRLDVTCSKGTYIRTLAEDIGKALGTLAHVTELKRLQSGPYKIEDAMTIDELHQEFEAGGFEALDAHLQPSFSAVRDWPLVELTELTASYFRQGQPVQVSKAPTDGWVRIFADSDRGEKQFIGVGEVLVDGRVAPRRLITAH